MKRILLMKDYIVDSYFNFFAKFYYTKMTVSIARKFHIFHKQCVKKYKSEILINKDIQKASQKFFKNGYTQYSSQETKDFADRIYNKIRKLEELDDQIWEKGSKNSKRLIEDPYLKFPELELLLKGDLGNLVSSILGCNFDLFSLTLIKSEKEFDSRFGSQLWHVDGNPGSCLNIVFYLHKVDKNFDPTSLLSFKKTLKLTKNRRVLFRKFHEKYLNTKSEIDKDLKAQIRRAFSNHYNKIIESDGLSFQPTGPAGLIAAFRNNVLHRGGYPEDGFQRYIIALNFYPSKSKPNYNKYRKEGFKKLSNYPQIPYF